MVGLDAAGKTTILYKLKLGEIVTTIPTIGRSSTLVLRFGVQNFHSQAFGLEYESSCQSCIFGWCFESSF